MFVIPTRELVRKGSQRGALSTMHLEEVRDYLVKLDKKQDPQDIDRSLSQLHVDMTKGEMTAAWINYGGVSEEMLVTSTGATDLAREVLPSRFFPGLTALAHMDDDGAKLATMAWAKFAADASNDPSFVRTVNVNVPGKGVKRAVRSRHSQSYAPYSHLEFVQDMLDCNDDLYSNMPIIDWRLTDNGMRLRFAACEEGEIEVNKPVPMVEGWNSETGLRRVVLKAGIWKLICTNGMGSWDGRSEFSWIHRGDPTRIKKGVHSAFDSLHATTSGVIDAYNDSLSISIDNAYEWLSQQLSGRTSDRVVTAAQNALQDATTTPGGKLASAVDAVTLIAQDEADIFEQYELERLAAELMHRGRGIALRNDGRIPVVA